LVVHTQPTLVPFFIPCAGSLHWLNYYKREFKGTVASGFFIISTNPVS
jgi:hypothetical protein